MSTDDFPHADSSQQDSPKEVLRVFRARRSVRHYQRRPLERDVLLRILEAARIAPSARNMQEWRFVVVQDPERRTRLVPACAGQKFVADAAAVVACCGTVTDYVMRCGQLSYPIDVAIAIDHMTLQAASEGVGSCWIGSFYEDQVKEILGIPESVRVVQLLTLGYPSYPLRPGPSSGKKRKALREIVSWERWSETDPSPQ